MSIVEFRGGPVTHRYLMNKTKYDLARLYMELLSVLERPVCTGAFGLKPDHDTGKITITRVGGPCAGEGGEFSLAEFDKAVATFYADRF